MYIYIYIHTVYVYVYIYCICIYILCMYIYSIYRNRYKGCYVYKELYVCIRVKYALKDMTVDLYKLNDSLLYRIPYTPLAMFLILYQHE